MSGLTALPRRLATLPALVAAADNHAQLRFVEFFAVNIRKPHTRRAYVRATGEFLGWCAARGVTSLAAVQPLHVAAYIEQLGREVGIPTVKQRLAGIRHLFDRLVVGQVVPVNPAASVRGLGNSVRRGKTPVLDPLEARRLLDAIDVRRRSACADRADRLFVRPDRCRCRCGSGTFTFRTDGYGCGCTRGAASGTRCRATTASRSIWAPSSTGALPQANAF